MKTKILITVVALICIAGIFRWTKKSEPQKQISYQEIPVERSNLKIKISSTGDIEPENRVQIKSSIAGRLEEVLFHEGQKVRKGQIIAWMSSTERAALLDSALAKGPEELKRWKEFYKATPIIAPITGTIILRSIEPGQTVTTSDAILVIADRLTVKAQVDETDISRIKKNQSAEIVLDAYADQTILGKVEKIAFDATTTNNVTTYVVTVLPDQVPDFMRSGMTANITFITSEKTDILTIPSQAIKKETQGKFVLKYNQQHQIEKFSIKIGISDNKKTEILDGLNEGEKILIEKAEPLTKKMDGAEQSKNPFMPQPPRMKK